VVFNAVELLTPPPPEPDADLNAKRQSPKAAKQITNDKFSMTKLPNVLAHFGRSLSSSVVLSRKVVQLKQDFCHKGTQRAQGQELIFFNFCDLCDLSWPFIFGCGLPHCSFAPLRLGAITFALKFPEPKCLFRVPFQLLLECHYDPSPSPKSSKKPVFADICDHLPPFAAHCRQPRKQPPAPSSRQLVLHNPRRRAGSLNDSLYFHLFNSISKSRRKRADNEAGMRFT
jgi:hypothetical protein